MGELSSAGVFPKSDSLPTAGQHSRFFDVQSDFFALSGKATSDELVRVSRGLFLDSLTGISTSGIRSWHAKTIDESPTDFRS